MLTWRFRLTTDKSPCPSFGTAWRSKMNKIQPLASLLHTALVTSWHVAFPLLRNLLTFSGSCQQPRVRPTHANPGNQPLALTSRTADCLPCLYACHTLTALPW